MPNTDNGILLKVKFHSPWDYTGEHRQHTRGLNQMLCYNRQITISRWLPDAHFRNSSISGAK